MAGLQGKRILLGVTGSISAYKAAEWTRALVKEEALVQVILTEAAERLLGPWKTASILLPSGSVTKAA